MGLRQRLSAPPADPAKQFCTIGKTLDSLFQEGPTDDPHSEYQALIGAMVNGAWSSSKLIEALRAEGYNDVSVRHMREHRTGQHTEGNCKRPQAGHIR